MKVVLLLFLFAFAYSIIIQGIDVSSYQGTINWKKVAESKKFAILRIGTGYNGKNKKDSKFEENYKNAKAAGVKVGAYWYSYATSVDDAKREANYCLQHLSGKQFEWPIYYDIEEEFQFYNGINNSIAKTFCEILEANHYYCGIYSSDSKWTFNFSKGISSRYSIWVAHLGTSRFTYTGTYDIWQKSETGSVSGISGNVALDECYLNFEPVMKANHLNGY